MGEDHLHEQKIYLTRTCTASGAARYSLVIGRFISAVVKCCCVIATIWCSCHLQCSMLAQRAGHICNCSVRAFVGSIPCLARCAAPCHSSASPIVPLFTSYRGTARPVLERIRQLKRIVQLIDDPSISRWTRTVVGLQLECS